MSTNGIEISVRAWTPAVPFKFHDNIISSKYTNAKKFIASYEKDRRPCMEQLMNNEYQRIWWKEKRLWDQLSSAIDTTEPSTTLPTTRRRILLRGLVKKRPPALAVPCTTDLQSATPKNLKVQKARSVGLKDQGIKKAPKIVRNYDLKMRTLECVGGKLKETTVTEEHDVAKDDIAEEHDVVKKDDIADRKEPEIVECH